jgi:hypothetical protein
MQNAFAIKKKDSKGEYVSLNINSSWPYGTLGDACLYSTRETAGADSSQAEEIIEVVVMTRGEFDDLKTGKRRKPYGSQREKPLHTKKVKVQRKSGKTAGRKT